MARVVAFDYGTKRVGIAVTDPMKMIATGLTTVHSKDIFDFIDQYLKKEDVDCFVLGEPKSLNNSSTHATEHVRAFAKKLESLYPDKLLHMIDERFTSKMATRAMIDGGLKKKQRQNKSLVDEISAT